MSGSTRQQKADLQGRGSFDLLTYAFERSPNQYNVHMPLYIDPTCPSRNLSAWETRAFVRRMVAGLKGIGLTEGDCVLVHLFNTVSSFSKERNPES